MVKLFIFGLIYIFLKFKYEFNPPVKVCGWKAPSRGSRFSVVIWMRGFLLVLYFSTHRHTWGGKQTMADYIHNLKWKDHPPYETRVKIQATVNHPDINSN